MVHGGKSSAVSLVEVTQTAGTVTRMSSTITVCKKRVSSISCTGTLNNRASGRWSEAEEAELTRIMSEMCKHGCGDSLPISWTEVSRKMNYRRNRQQ
jgi:hypothetical protein